jgi:FkbM family methyltransferase
MLISVSELSKHWGIKPDGVLHVGAHLGEEARQYEENGWLPVIWVEAQPKLAVKLRESLNPQNHQIIEAAVWNLDNQKLTLHVASNSMSSSLLEFGSHSLSYPDIKYVDEIQVKTKRLDSILDESQTPNFINVDIQGAELMAIESLGDLIKSFDYIFVEVNRREVYKDCTNVRQLDSYLSEKEFKRVTTRWYFREGWGDALYIRKNKIHSQSPRQYALSKSKTFVFYLRQILRIAPVRKIIRNIQSHTHRSTTT